MQARRGEEKRLKNGDKFMEYALKLFVKQKLEATEIDIAIKMTEYLLIKLKWNKFL